MTILDIFGNDLSIGIVGYRLSIGIQQWPCRLVVVEFKFVISHYDYINVIALSLCRCQLQVSDQQKEMVNIFFSRKNIE